MIGHHSTTSRRFWATVLLWHLVVNTSPNPMTSMFLESCYCRTCHLTSTSTLSVLSASFNYDNYVASDVLLTTMLLHLFMHLSQAESIITAVSWLALRRRWLTSYNVYLALQHESSRICASSTGDSLISGEVSYAGWNLLTGFHSESAFRFSGICTSWFLVTATCSQLTAVTWTSLCVRLATYGRRVFAYAGPLNWNLLSAHLRDNSLPLSAFKRHLKIFLFSFY